MKRTRSRGFAQVTLMLEAAAVVGWFVVLVLGEKLVGDATAARRAVERAAQTSVVAAATRYCGDPGAAPEQVDSASTQADPDGAPDARDALQIVAGLGVGSEPTFSLYTDPFTTATATARRGDVKGAKVVGDHAYTFEGERRLACIERPKDAPTTSIAKYRASIFGANIEGY